MIDIFFNVLRKGLVATIALIFAFVIIYVPQEYNHYHTVPQAQALFGVDIPNLIQNTISAVVSVALKLKEFVLDGIAWTIAKAIVARMVSSLVDWINSGFKGSPAFITNLDQFLLDAADEAAGEFIEKLGGDASFLCEPFKLDIQIALAVEYANVRENKPYEGCRISDFVGSAEDFFNGTFEEGGGGWQNWIKVTTEPEKYTPYGQTIEAEKAMAIDQAKTKTNETKQLDFGSGFKSFKVCSQVPQADGTSKKDCKVTTPPKAIADSLSKSLGAGQDTLVTADEISEIIGALFAQLANKAITGVNGLLGMSSNTGYTYSGFNGGSYTNATNAQMDTQVTQAQNNTGNVSSTTAGGGTAATSGQSPVLTDVSNAISVQGDYLALADAKVPVLQAYIADTTNPAAQRTLATQYLSEAQAVQQTVPGNLTKLNALAQQLTNLEAELQNPQTTPIRLAQIPVEQQAAAAQYNTLTLYTQAQLDAATTNWSQF
jgi:hypothetical protein